MFVSFAPRCFRPLLQGSSGEIVCEDLPTEVCSFSIASSGKRCLLENTYENSNDGKTGYQCRTSEVVVERMSEYIETDECVKACGVDRNSVGISSDTLLEAKSGGEDLLLLLCYQNCPNIVYICRICWKRTNKTPTSTMIELLSSGAAAGPVGSENLVGAAPAPVGAAPAPTSV
ncbi:PAR1-like protein [Tanacetum coccineum]